jgi:hypothetical protein
LLIQGQKNVVGKGNIELEQSTRANDEQKALQLFLSNPENWQTDGRVDTFKLNKGISTIAPITGGDVISKLTALGEAQAKNTEAIGNLSKSQRSIIAGPIGVLGRRGEQDPKVYIEELEHIRKMHPNQQELHKLIDIQIDELKKSKAGPNVSKSAIAGSEYLLSPEQQITQYTPKAGIVTIDGKPAESVNVPSVSGEKPSASITVPGSATQRTEQQPATSTQMYPKRAAGDLTPYRPGEAEDEKVGIAYRNGLVKRQGELTTSKRNLDEVIKEATGLKESSWPSTGITGTIIRKFRDFAGDPTYKQLSKDLANVQISNIQAMGGSMDTVSGQQLTKMANGDETYPPEVLIGIARRAYADLTDLDMRATAAQKFSQKFGDSNMNAFKQQWAANSDSKLFEAIAIEKSNLPVAEKKKQFKELIGNDPNVLKGLQQKKKNLEKLMATGEL